MPAGQPLFNGAVGPRPAQMYRRVEAGVDRHRAHEPAGVAHQRVAQRGGPDHGGGCAPQAPRRRWRQSAQPGLYSVPKSFSDVSAKAWHSAIERPPRICAASECR